MGLMSDHYTATYDGHSIEVEGRVTSIMGSAEYSLVVDNQRVDQIQGSLGRFVLRGQLVREGSAAKTVQVRIKQGLLGTKYTLDVEGVECPLRKT